MQNFTLGKKGITMFFFALTLLTGSLPSFGQECPTVSASDQSFCDSQEPQIDDLNATGNNISWYASRTSTDPLPATQILINGTTYFAGTSNNSCFDNRASVLVTVFSQPEITGINATPPTTRQSLAVIGICVADVTDPNVFVRDLRTNYDGVDDVAVNWYLNRTSTTPLSGDTELQNNTDYFASLTVLDQTTGDVICETNRRRTTVRLYSEAAPTGPSPQDFCSANNPTLADIEASGNNRYFTSETSNTELSSSTPLVNGRTYYISSVGEFCESLERLAVTVNVFDPEDLGTPEQGIVCENEVQETFPSIDAIRNYYLALLPAGVPTNGTLNPTAEQIAQMYQSDADGLGDFNTTYTVTVGDCPSTIELSVSILPSEVATVQPIDDDSVCVSEDGLDLSTYIAGNTMGGTFTSNNGTISGTILDISQPEAYNIVYTVAESDPSTCLTGTASEEFTITVGNSDAIPVDTIDISLCSGQVTDFLANPSSAVAYFSQVLAENGITDFTGTFEQPLEAIYAQWMQNPIGTFESTYTVGEPGCQDSVDISIVVTEGNASAGNPNIGIVCDADVQATFPSFDEIRKYYLALLDPGVPTNGTLNPTPEQIAQQYQNDADGLGDFVATYTVTNGSCTDSVELTVRIVDNANAGENGSVTLNEDDAPVNLFDYLGGNPDEGGTWSPGNGTFDPSTDAEGTYTYTVGTASCQDTATVVVTVQETTDPTDPTCTVDAGNPNMGVVCDADVQATFPSFDEIRKYYLALLDPGVPTNGTLNPTPEQIAQQYQNDADGLGDFVATYTVTNGDCSDSVQLTVRIVENANAGENGSVTLNEDAAPVNLFDYLGGNPDEGGTWSPGNGTFNPSTDAEGTFTYTVGTASCQDTATVVVTVQETTDPTDPTDPTCTVDAGNPNIGVVCLADVQAVFPSVDEIRKYYLALLNSGVPTNGTLNPTAAQIAQMYQSDADGLGDFVSTYTITNGDCSDSVQLTVRIVEDANAGENGSVTLNEDAAPVNLFNYLGGNPDEGGTWSPGNGTFNPSTDTGGTFTYTVGTASCQDTATVVVTVQQTTDPTDPTCTISAGADKSKIVCRDDVNNLSNAGVRTIFLNLLDQGVRRDGAFSPTISQIVTQYNTVSNFGDFTTTYTVRDGDCTDSTVLTITVVPVNNAGNDREISFCSTEAAVNLFDYLSANATDNGSFVGYANGIFNPATATPGVTTVTYQVEEDETSCSTSNFTSTLTITVNTPVTANAGGNVEVEYCIEQNEDIQLTSLLGADAVTIGTFSAPYANGIFNPSVAGAGEFEITYTVNEGNCTTGSDSATINIVVNASSEAPVADAEQFFCLGDSPTVADLVATGDTVVWYENEELTIEAASTTALADGDVYYAVEEGDNACGRPSTMVTVTLNDSVAPTLTMLGDEFCRADSPTVQDLINNLNGPAINIYSAPTGGTPLATSAVLVNGTTYYATSTDAAVGCESTERLAVTAKVGFCGIPEGFSPNGDTVNDTFEIPFIRRDFPNYNIEIYNRWGDLVYRGNEDWDGISNQSTTLGDGVLPAGVYFYILNYNDGQTTPVQGKVYLSR